MSDRGLGDLMKQAQQMQQRLAELQEEIARLEVTGESGAGLVKVTVNGRHEARRVSIDSSLLAPKNADDRAVLEDLVAAAFNDAAHRLERLQKEKMTSLASGLGLPAGFPLSF